MKISIDQLPEQLQKKLAAIYLVSGDETLLVEEACKKIRETATNKGFTEHQIHYVETHFNWGQLSLTINNLSLFSQHTLIELRIANSKINDLGKKILIEYATPPPTDKILLIVMEKLDASVQKTQWFKTIEKNGVFLPIWPMTPQQLPVFLQKRLKAVGLTVEPDALHFLSERVEGNLLAAQQEIEKLPLLFDKTHLTLDDLILAVCHSAHYDIFNLADCVLMGDAKRTLHILTNLKNEGAEPTLILWALTREIRNLISVTEQLENGLALETALQKSGVWEKRKILFRACLKRHTKKTLMKLLQQANKIDWTIKGASFDNVWAQFNQLGLDFCGVYN